MHLNVVEIEICQNSTIKSTVPHGGVQTCSIHIDIGTLDTKWINFYNVEFENRSYGFSLSYSKN